SYVCAHEAAHLKEMNHSRAFWKIVGTLSPAYKESIKWLKDNSQDLFKYGE
ncbi:MAG: M48 family metallopeptidase, partial [Alphaproteobacteria bacterium]|nr:M48 family metallopeptidase [Alphaproteobacteria bacterium]